MLQISNNRTTDTIQRWYNLWNEQLLARKEGGDPALLEVFVCSFGCTPSHSLSLKRVQPMNRFSTLSPDVALQLDIVFYTFHGPAASFDMQKCVSERQPVKHLLHHDPP